MTNLSELSVSPDIELQLVSAQFETATRVQPTAIPTDVEGEDVLQSPLGYVPSLAFSALLVAQMAFVAAGVGIILGSLASLLIQSTLR